jgi:ABC-2 type transport system ATP-binding protein/ribosome-dependent ATPase
MTRPLVSARGVSRDFGELLAVDDVSLEVGPGEIVGLLGANGAGKTTLLRMVLGLLAPTAGTLELMGGAPNRATRARIGYVPQGRGLWEDLTLRENLAFTRDAFGGEPGPPPAGLEEWLDRPAKDVGLGTQRTAAFAAALSHRPALLILDEPTSGVDPLSRARLWDQIHAAADSGVGVLVTTHYMQEAQQCDRLLLMSRGREVARGTEADIVAGVQVTAVHGEPWQRAFEALADAGFVVALAGRSVRVVSADRKDIDGALRRAGVEARLEAVAPTLEEAMAAREVAA